MNSDLSRDARYWWNRAKDVRLAAVGMKSRGARAAMLDVAAAYLRMVERAQDNFNRWQQSQRDELQSKP
jgi:hypothetical protein